MDKSEEETCELMEEERDKTLNLRKKLDDERQENEEQNLVEIKKYQEQVHIEKQKTERVVSKMKLENMEKKYQIRQEVQCIRASTQQSLLNAQNTCLKNDRLIKLNREIAEMTNMHLSIQQSFDSCIKYIGVDFVWNPSFFKRAEMKFNALEKKIQEFALHVNRMKPKLRSIPEENERREVIEQVKRIMNAQGELKTSAAKFSGCMMNQRQSWKNNDVVMFKQLYTELGQGVNSITTLDTLHTEIRVHLQGISSFQSAAIQ